MKVYFAHPVTDYGTAQETADIATLEGLGLEVVNPAGNEDNYKKYGMEFFLEMVDGCDALAFRPFVGGSIGAGVADEIIRATVAGMPIIELPADPIQRALNVVQTRRIIKSLSGKG